jgi:hypothetical protein
MRKNLIVSFLAVIVILIFCRNLGADWGIKAGPSLSLAGEKSAIYDASSLLAARFGLFFSFSMTNVLDLQPGVDFAMKGARYYDVNWRATLSTHFNYVEFPLLLSIQIFPRSLAVFGGPYLGILVSSTKLDEEHMWTWRENKLKSTDYGVTFGARYKFKVIFIELQYNHGLMDIINNPGSDDLDVHKNRTIALLVGFLL